MSFGLCYVSRLRRWEILTIAFTGQFVFVYIAHHFILLQLNPFDLGIVSERWWLEHSLPWLQVCLSAEGVKIISYSWLSPLQRWGSLTMTLPSKFVYIYIHIYKYIYIHMYKYIYIYIYIYITDMYKDRISFD